MVEDKTYKTFTMQDMHTPCIVLTGHLRDGIRTAWGDYEPTIISKYLTLIFYSGSSSRLWNYTTISQIYPEYRFIFNGDNGQADHLVGRRLIESYPNSVMEVFVHQVIPLDQMVGYTGMDWSPRQNYHFFKTYIGAAIGMTMTPSFIYRFLDGFLAGLISLEGLARVIQATKTDFEKIEKQILADCAEAAGGKSLASSSRNFMLTDIY